MYEYFFVMKKKGKYMKFLLVEKERKIKRMFQ